MPTDVVLSMWMGVGGCGWPNLWRVILVFFASCVLRKNYPRSASAADATTSLRIAQVMWIFLFNRMDFPSIGMLPRKKYPPDRLWPLPADNYDSLEWILSIIAEA